MRIEGYAQQEAFDLRAEARAEARRREHLGERLRRLREARERAGASCP